MRVSDQPRRSMASVMSGRSRMSRIPLVAVVLTLIIGVSRVYLGVHWPTDVLAGWAAGTMWAVVCWQVARRRRGIP